MKSKVGKSFVGAASIDSFLRMAPVGKPKMPIVYEGKTSSGGHLFLSSNGTRVHYSWVDRAGMKEGWMCDNIALIGCYLKIGKLQQY